MLVLARQQGQRICIGNGVIVTVLGATRGKVRLGIEAPPDVRVDREEVRRRLHHDPAGGVSLVQAYS
jgi:carbon storage regulator